MTQPANRRGEPPQPDANDTPQQHDQQGRAAGPYAPPGRDEQGNPVPSVPHEGLLGRIGVAIVLGEAVVLAAVGIAGLVTSWGAGFTEQVPNTVLALRLNPAHSVLLLVTAVAGAACTLKRSSLRAFAITQAVVYILLFVFGSAFSVSTGGSTFLALNTPDHVLHGVLAILGFIVLMVSSARIVEPPPGSLPYPGAIEREDGQQPEGPTPASPEPDRSEGSSGEWGGPQGPQGQERAGDRG
ncbi:DUF4383 domain-containing protein [Actinomycetospora cinnamomea]|uniref:Uncharacterized protein DUF4383 n=1 Tax=Actinomycetospora cinnamomea TaxID=663609 RepID=A0A2U1FA96_9PSEU|nr:DUF4383 domain-containing protein [Actinomycetospora cinnamomea]PVZ09096.1 uncharacterized protein DUF4383 [Actinomycetospora cinnamomea]